MRVILRPTISCYSQFLRIKTDFWYRFTFSINKDPSRKKFVKVDMRPTLLVSEITPKKLAWDQFFSWVKWSWKVIFERRVACTHSQSQWKIAKNNFITRKGTFNCITCGTQFNLKNDLFKNPNFPIPPRAGASSQTLANSPLVALINFCLLVRLQQYLLTQCANVQQRFSTVLLLQAIARIVIFLASYVTTVCK